MTPEQVKDAVEQVKVHCDLLMENYELVSLRGALYTLGYNEEQADEVILTCAEQGFSYCIDPLIHVKDPDNPKKTTRVEYSVCHWGPDQLQSRLAFIRIPA